MKLDEMICMLERNNALGMFVYDPAKRRVDRVIYLESTCRLRYWFFNEHGDVVSTKYVDAPNGEMDLLNVYANEITNHGIECVAWCG